MRDQIRRLVRSGCDLSFRQMFILFECEDKAAPITVKELAERGGANMSKPAVSRGVQRLLELGYVDRTDHPSDRRSVLVSLTPGGRSFVKKAAAP